MVLENQQFFILLLAWKILVSVKFLLMNKTVQIYLFMKGQQNLNLGTHCFVLDATFAPGFFFYDIDIRTVFVVCLFPKKTAQKRRRSSVPKLQQAQLGCLWPTGRFKKKSVWIKRKTQPVEPVSSQNLSFWRFEALLNQNACFWGLTQITDFLIPLNFYFPFSRFIDPVRCSYLGVSDVFLTHFWSGSSAYQ